MLIDYIAIEKRVDLMNARREGSRALYSEIDEELEDLEKISDELEKLKMN